MGPEPHAAHVAAILNAAWWVRHYRRRCQAQQRAQAVRVLGLAVRLAFTESENFEPLLIALVSALSPRDDAPPF